MSLTGAISYYAWNRGLLHGVLRSDSWKERLLGEFPVELTASGILDVRPDGSYAILARKSTTAGDLIYSDGHTTESLKSPILLGVVPGRGPFYWFVQERLLGRQYPVGLGKQVSAPYEALLFSFSRPTGRFAYAGARNGKWAIYKDLDVSYQELESAPLGLVISDSGVIAYSVQKKARDFFSSARTEVHVGNRKWEVDGVQLPYGISRDGSVLAMSWREGNRIQLRIGDNKGPFFDAIPYYSFSPDASQIAYAARQGQIWHLVYGNEIGPAYEEVGDVEFSPASSEPFFWAKRGGSWSIRGTRSWEPIDGLTPEVSNLAVSPDAQHVAYRACADECVIVVDQAASPAYGRVGDPVFSPDGKKVGFGALVGRQIWWKVVDVPIGGSETAKLSPTQGNAESQPQPTTLDVPAPGPDSGIEVPPIKATPTPGGKPEQPKEVQVPDVPLPEPGRELTSQPPPVSDTVAAATGAYKIGGGVSPPKLLSKVEPEYSAEAHRAKLQGIVQIEIVVDEHGIPKDLRVKRGLGLGLDQKALEAVAKWRFQPGTKDGKPVPVFATVQVNFRLL